MKINALIVFIYISRGNIREQDAMERAIQESLTDFACNPVEQYATYSYCSTKPHKQFL